VGRGGFPTLLFLDLEGRPQAEPRSRKVASFAKCRDALTSIDACRERAEAGDPAAAIELLLLEVELRKVDRAQFEERARALEPGADAEARANIDCARLDFEILDLMDRSYRSDPEGAAADALEMIRNGRLPDEGCSYRDMFWSVAFEHVRASGDAALIRLAARELRKAFPHDEFQVLRAQTLEELAAGLDERDALLERARAGEVGLEAKILLIELRLGAIPYDACKQRLEAALAVATEAEAVELRQLAVDLEVNELVADFWSNRDREAVAARLVELYASGDPIPSESSTMLALGPLSIHFGRGSTPEKTKLVARLEELVEAAPHLARLIDSLTRS
jgi:hypothetical protein